MNVYLDTNNVLKILWDFVMMMLSGVGKLWQLLTTPIPLGFDLPIIGFVGFTIPAPILVFGASIVVFWIIKAIVPVL